MNITEIRNALRTAGMDSTWEQLVAGQPAWGIVVPVNVYGTVFITGGSDGYGHDWGEAESEIDAGYIVGLTRRDTRVELPSGPFNNFSASATLKQICARVEIAYSLTADAGAAVELCSCGHARSRHSSPFGECRSAHNAYGSGPCNCREFVGVPAVKRWIPATDFAPYVELVVCATCDREIPESEVDQHADHRIIRSQQIVDAELAHRATMHECDDFHDGACGLCCRLSGAPCAH